MYPLKKWIFLFLVSGIIFPSRGQLLSKAELESVKNYYPYTLVEDTLQVISLNVGYDMNVKIPYKAQMIHMKEFLPKVHRFKNIQQLFISCNDSSLNEVVADLMNQLHLFTNLQELYLNSNNILNLPESMFKLKNIKILSLPFVELNIPAQIKNLTQLEELNWEFFPYTTFPKNIFNLITLKYINLNYANKLKHIPIGIGKMKSLQKLVIGSSLIQELPSDIGDLKQLNYMVFASESLSYLPASFTAIAQLRELWIEGSLAEMPQDMYKLTHLKKITLMGTHHIQFEKLFPVLSKMDSLEELNLPYIQQPLPENVRLLRKIIFLGLDENREITLEKLPATLTQLTQLRTITLQGTGIKETDSLALRKILPATEFYFDYRYCFVENTPIYLPNGKVKSIQDIQVGDSVMGYNTSMGKFEITVVESLMVYTKKTALNHIFYSNVEKKGFISPSIQGNISATDDHPFYTQERQWVAAKKLTTKKILQGYFPEFSEKPVYIYIRSNLRIRESVKKVYTLRTQNHTFIAARIIVHNK